MNRSERTSLKGLGYYLPALIVAVAVLVAIVLTDMQKRRLEEEYLRSFTTEQLALLQSRLQGNIQGDIKLAQGLVATLSTEPDMSPGRFAELAGRIFREDTQLRNLAIAPDFVVTLAYPLKGNERSIGLDYRKNEAQRAAAMLVRDLGRIVVTGPVELVQGGLGVIARYPIHGPGKDGRNAFRGIASAVIDLDRLLAASGFKEDDLKIAVSITSRPHGGAAARPFFTTATPVDLSPVVMTVDIGHEEWTLSASPPGGWHQSSAGLGPFRTGLALIALIVVAPMIWVGYLMKDRHRHIRALEQAHRVMEHNALHDALTRLPNRRFLDQQLSQASAAAGRDGPLTLLHIDLDRFKDINDTLGHAAGDDVLKHAAGVLRDHIPAEDFIARIGGDEFVLLSRREPKAADFTALATRLIAAISEPMTIAGHDCRIGASVGIATRGEPGESAEQLLVNADIALYEAKRRGRNRVESFNDELRLRTVGIKRLGDDILRGLERQEFRAFFQPQFDARTLEIVGVEALARWEHPTRGFISPDTFLPVAETLNVVARIDEAILDQALFQAARWRAQGLDIPRVSVNVSCQRLRDETLVDKLRGMNIRPGTLTFELLESISFDGADDALKRSIEEIKALGIDIEIDDFGTGHASIVSLLELSPKRLKIDRRLILPLIESRAQQSLVGSIIDIGRVRGIEIVAEGVETLAHAELLRKLGCHALQGYAFARPMAADAFLAFARAREWMPQRLSRAAAR